jgi:hypothetical protein
MQLEIQGAIKSIISMQHVLFFQKKMHDITRIFDFSFSFKKWDGDFSVLG